MILQCAESQRPRDPGLQAERTALAWNRTGLAVFANALLALRSGWVNKEVPITLLAFALLVASAAAFLYGAGRRRELLGGQGASAPPAAAVAMASVIALGTCVIGVATMLLR